jgi:hypothetical protein
MGWVTLPPDSCQNAFNSIVILYLCRSFAIIIRAAASVKLK